MQDEDVAIVFVQKPKTKEKERVINMLPFTRIYQKRD